jgi:hypothetical protein
MTHLGTEERHRATKERHRATKERHRALTMTVGVLGVPLIVHAKRHGRNAKNRITEQILKCAAPSMTLMTLMTLNSPHFPFMTARLATSRLLFDPAEG